MKNLRESWARGGGSSGVVVLRIAGAALLTLLIGAAAQASTLVTLEDVNSKATFELDPVSPNGMISWEVDGVDQVYEQWFYYRIGDEPERNISEILNGEPSNLIVKTTDTGSLPAFLGGDPRDDTLSVTWVDANMRFYIVTDFKLVGGSPGSLSSDMGEQIRIVNLGSEPLDFHFFQYCNFDLQNTPHDDRVRILGGNTVQQYDPNIMASETVVTPPPSHYEVAWAPDILNRLNDGKANNLEDIDTLMGTGDATWAFQWDFELTTSGTGSEVQISKDKNFFHTPEPLTVLGMFLGLGSVGAYIRRRRLR